MIRPRIKIHNLSLQVHLGCTAEERAKTQEVLVSAEIQFSEPPPGEKSDQLDHTICYAQICESFKQTLERKEFQLVEKMAHLSFKGIKNKWPSAKIQIVIHKVRPPIEGLRDGVTYVCGDEFL